MRPSLMLLCLALVALLSGCGGTTEPVVNTKQLQVLNYLAEPVSLIIDGTAYGSIQVGTLLRGPTQVLLTIPSSATSLTYTVSPEHYSDGSAVANDLSGETVTLGVGNATLGINNIVQGQSYFFPVMIGPGFTDAHTKYGTDTISFDIGVPGARRCLGSVSGNFPTAAWGYYRLTPQTEMRLFAGSSCQTARYMGTWATTVLNTMAIDIGWLFLSY